MTSTSTTDSSTTSDTSSNTETERRGGFGGGFLAGRSHRTDLDTAVQDKAGDTIMNSDKSGPGDPSRRERLASQVRGWLHRLAVEGFATETVWVPLGATGMASELTRATVADPLAGVRAAVLARTVAARMVGEYAGEARGAGRTWEEIADALNLDQDDPTRPGDVGRAERAFEQIAGESTYRWTARARWTCAACGARVNDYGPFESHPRDREDGHTDHCPRQRAALAAWKTDVEGTEGGGW